MSQNPRLWNDDEMNYEMKKLLKWRTFICKNLLNNSKSGAVLFHEQKRSIVCCLYVVM